jgi:hypothetical protein
LSPFLKNYERRYSSPRWFNNWGGLTSGREGYVVFFRFVFLLGLYVTVFYQPPVLWLQIPMTVVAVYFIFESFLLPTSIAFTGVPPWRPLRALSFVFMDYMSIAAAYSVLYITLCRTSFNIVPSLIDLIYFSFCTLTTLGIGDIYPSRHTVLVKLLAISEIVFGLYFWAVLVGTIISWANKDFDSSMPSRP